MATRRNGEIDILRFIFSILIVVHHYCYLFGFKLFGHTSRGYIGVEFFFLVTGYLMAKSVSKNEQQLTSREIANNTWSFLRKKVSVFYLYYVFSYVLQVIAKLLFYNWSAGKAFDQALRLIPNATLSFVGVVANSNYYISGNWYLSAMMIALLVLYPLLLKNYHLSSKLLFPLGAIFLMGHMYHNYTQVIVSYTDYTFMSTGLIRALIEIAMGVSLFELSKVIDSRKFNKVLMTLVKLFAYFVVFFYAFGHTDRSFDIHALLWCGVAVMLSFCESTFRIGENRLTRYLGKISLPIYIFHTVIMRCAQQVLGEKISLKMLLFLIVISVLSPVVLMHIIDAVQGWFKKRKAAAAA